MAAGLNAEDARFVAIHLAQSGLVLVATRAPGGGHPDDLAVDRFATAMKAKLAKKREEGRGGWDGPDCNAEVLSRLLREHVEKGDPLDVGNLAMMLHQRGERIAAEPVSGVTVQEAARVPEIAALIAAARTMADGPPSRNPEVMALRAALSALEGK